MYTKQSGCGTLAVNNTLSLLFHFLNVSLIPWFTGPVFYFGVRKKCHAFVLLAKTYALRIEQGSSTPQSHYSATSLQDIQWGYVGGRLRRCYCMGKCLSPLFQMDLLMPIERPVCQKATHNSLIEESHLF
jgi:hypothetical protein